MRRRRWLALVLVAVAAVVLLAVLSWPASLEERVERLRVGMTEAEVVAILGPPGNHSRHYAIIHRGGGPDEGRISDWMWDDGHVGVWFGDDGRVKSIYFAPHDPPSLLDRLCSRLGL